MVQNRITVGIHGKIFMIFNVNLMANKHKHEVLKCCVKLYQYPLAKFSFMCKMSDINSLELNKTD